MKIVIMCKNKAIVKLIKKCKSEDLIVMLTSLLEESIKSLSEEKNISMEKSVSTIRELLDETMFTIKK